MPNFFSIAGIRTVGKPKPQVPPGNHHQNTTQNLNNSNEVNGASHNNNEGNATNAATSPSNIQATTTTNAASKPSHQQQHQTSHQTSLFHKYPGSGKLTIQQKKGKSPGGFSKSIIRRVPIYNEDYDSSDDEEETSLLFKKNNDVCIPQRLLLQTDEAILMDELDAEISRQEEKELLDKWNDEIVAQEEVDLMHRLWINIEHATYLEQCAAKPSAVVEVEDNVADSNDESQNKDRPLLSAKVPESKPLSKQLVFPPTIGEIPTEPTGVEITGAVDFCKASIKLPRYLDQEHNLLAFTRAEFYTGVIQPFEKDLLGQAEKSLCGWEARILVSEEDPFSYTLKVRGQKDLLEELKRQAELWVQDRIRMINSYLLLQDGATVVIDNLVEPRLIKEAVKRERRAYKEKVVEETEKTFGWIDKHVNKENRPPSLRGWKVNVQFKLHPDLCTIDATGSTEVLAHLSEATRDWVQTQSLYAITDSFESSQLTGSTRGTPSKRIRITFRYPRCVPLGYENRSQKLSKSKVPVLYSNCGVWLAGINNRTLLSYMMGGPAAFEKGCTLIAIHGNECNTPDDLQYIYSQARETEKNCVKLTLCLSRFTDFSSIPN
mmetsp:Transcript_44907/g.108518  ORF Transcript_44907/g.108518 Transcript_44907/m.108518 type:complete len:604 (-) Transcript_44907:14-1825(-)